MVVEIVDREGTVLVVNVRHPILTNGILCVRGGDGALPKLLWDILLHQLGLIKFYLVGISTVLLMPKSQQSPTT